MSTDEPDRYPPQGTNERFIFYRLDEHGRRLKDVETAVKLQPVLEEKIRNIAAELANGFAAQGEEIKSLRRAVVGAAISISSTSLVFALTIFLVFRQ